MPFYPLGLSYLAAVLERHGFEVVVYNSDYNYRELSLPFPFRRARSMLNAYEQYLHILEDLNHPLWQEIGAVITHQAPDLVGITVMTGQYGSAVNIARLVKRLDPSIPVVVGGVHPTILPGDMLRHQEIDIEVRGEGEYTLLELASKLKSGKPLDNVLGITYRHNNEILSTPNRPLIENLDELPFPARHLLYEKETFPSSAFGRIFAARGCPYQCTYCASHKVWTRRVRYRSPRNVVAEIRRTKEAFGTQYFYFDDDTFTINKQYVLKICDLLKEGKLGITWGCETRAGLIDNELARRMRAAGCEFCNVGVESGDEATLRRIKKGVTIPKIKDTRRIMKEAGISFNAFFMIGFPWEAKDEVEKTVSLMRELQPDLAYLSIVTPYPGTELYEECLSKGLLTQNIDWRIFFHQSPDIFLTTKLTKEEWGDLVEYTSGVFDKYNRSRRWRHLRLLRLFYKEGYFKPRLLSSFLTRVLPGKRG